MSSIHIVRNTQNFEKISNVIRVLENFRMLCIIMHYIVCISSNRVIALEEVLMKDYAKHMTNKRHSDALFADVASSSSI